MTEKNWLQNFARSEEDSWIGGVCGGLGESTPLPSWVWRLMFVLIFAITYGMGFFIYILLWIFVPTKSKIEDQ